MQMATVPDYQTAITAHNPPDQPPAYDTTQPTRLHSIEVVSYIIYITELWPFYILLFVRAIKPELQYRLVSVRLSTIIL